jgi:DNA invertase Pin-like site-specific DNA recombinase
MTENSNNQNPIGQAYGRRRRSINRPRLVETGVSPDELGPGTQVAIYVRVSTEEQVEGFSLAAQERACREFADRHEWIVYKLYADPGHSGKNDRRPGFQQMMADAAQGKFKVLLVHKLDRFSRSIENTLKNFRELHSYQTTIASVSEAFDYTTAQGRMFFHMMAVFAQWYLENLSAEVIKGKEEMARQGKHNGRLPFGYIKDNDGNVLVVPEEAEIVRQAFELYSLGQHTDRQIADYLNENHFTTRRGRTWSKDTVRDFMLNEFFIGMVVHRNQLYRGKHDAIISKELFEKCLAVREQHSSRRRAYNSSDVAPKRVYMLQRIVRCNACERHLRMQSSKKFTYYKEASKERGLSCEHAGESIRMDRADAQVKAFLGRIRLPADWQRKIEKIAEDMDQIKNLEKKRVKVQRDLQRLGKAYADGTVEEDEYERRRHHLQSELGSITVPNTAQVTSVGLQLEMMDDLLPAATEAELAEIGHLLLEAVYVDMPKENIVRFKPKGEFFTLFQMAAAETGWQEKDGDFWLPADDAEIGS